MNDDIACSFSSLSVSGAPMTCPGALTWKVVKSSFSIIAN